MTLLDSPILRLDGTPTTLSEMTGGKVALVVNVASRCGLTPQYAALEALHEQYSDRGFTVIGVPCNQFDGQEPGTRSEIADFSSMTYGVTFPMTDKVNVNEPGRHPIYAELTAVDDDEGEAGDVEWNFEKFLLDRAGVVVRRFRPDMTPDDPRILKAIEATL
jgi:glutathione peroxidase